MAWTVDNMRTKIKTLVGNEGLADADLLTRLNNFYRDVLPLEFHLVSLETGIVINLVDGTNSYTVDPDEYLYLRPPALLDDLTTGSERELRFREDFISFRREWPDPTIAGSYIKGIPSQVLYWEHDLFPRPVPDDAYFLGVRAYRKPTAFAAGGDTPTENLWGPVLCYDVAMDVLMDTQDTDPIEGLAAARNFFAKKITTKEIMQFESVRTRGSF